jgi:predicted ArsR family transcriptional regulator
MTAPALGGELGIATEGVRRHLHLLERDGLVEAEPETARTGGRPATKYRLTAAGLERFPHDYVAFARAAADYLERIGALEGFLDDRVEGMAARYAPVMAGVPAARRPAALAGALSEDGFMASVEPTADGLAICQHHCTLGRLPEEHPEICEAEARLFSRLLDRPVHRTHSVVAGDDRCVALVDHASFPRPHPRSEEHSA